MKKIILVLTMMASSAAMAQQEVNKWYFGGELGSAAVANSTGAIASSLVGQLGGSATVTQDSSVAVGRLFLGYKVNPYLDAEIGYFGSDSINYRASGVSGGSVAYGAALDVDYKGLDYSILVRPLGNDRTLKGAFIRVGGHRSEVNAALRVTAGGVSLSNTFSDSGNGYLYGAGFDFDFGANWFGRLAVTRMEKIAGNKDDAGTVYSFGAGYKF